jgi:phosphoribosylformimino-5-aminoimidazole carboxamide ribotide isomerase
MILYPAMDFIEGKCVRLYQGELDQREYFDQSALAWAKSCEQAGAKQLHMIDLDGAFTGTSQNLSLLRSVKSAVKIPIQVGGGIRSPEQARLLIEEGFQVILGTLLLKDLESCAELVKQYPDRLVASVDCKNGMVTLEGWTEVSTMSSLTFVRTLAEMGFKKIVYTDISKDGTLDGPNYDDLAQLLSLRSTNALSFELVASGGVGSLDDLKRLKKLGVDAVIVGRALLNADISLVHALEVCDAD